MNYLKLKDHPYYFRLKEQDNGKGLLDNYEEEDLANGLIVQYEVPAGLFPRSPDLKRLYAAFTNSYASFFSHHEKFEPFQRCFYETILGSYSQKPHFDIDLEIADDEAEADYQGITLVEELLQKCHQQFRSWGLTLDYQRDILLFSSHGQKKEGEKILYKRSYHLVIDNYCHRNHQEAKEFYRLITKAMFHRYKDAIDPKVYSSIQQFRILGSTKAGKNRPKTIVTNFVCPSLQISHPPYEDLPRKDRFKWFTRSLISNTRDCHFLQSLETISRFDLDLPEASESEVNTAVRLLYEWSTSFEVLEVKKSMITLRRLEPSFCPLCQRVHEAENPYLLLRDGQALWNCRRTDSFHFLGSLEREDSRGVEKPNSPEILSSSSKKLDVLSMISATKRNLRPGFLTPCFSK